MLSTELANLLERVLYALRWGGMIIIAIVGMGLLISEGTKSKLAPGRVITVVGSALLAAVLFYILPTLINYARIDGATVLPDHPIGGY